MNSKQVLQNITDGIIASQRNMPVGEALTITYSPVFLQVVIQHMTGRRYCYKAFDFTARGFENMPNQMAADIGEVFAQLRTAGVSPKLATNGEVHLKLKGRGRK